MISHPDQLDTEVPVPLIRPVEHHRRVFVLELRGTHCQVSLSLSPQTGWDTQLAVWTKRERMSVPRVPSQASSHPTHTQTQPLPFFSTHAVQWSLSQASGVPATTLSFFFCVPVPFLCSPEQRKNSFHAPAQRRHRYRQRLPTHTGA